MRPIWKGQISFGLVNVPIELYPAKKSNNLKFNLLDNRDQGEVRYERINQETGEEVPWQDVVRAYKVAKKDYVILNEEDFNQASIAGKQRIEIQDFINKDELDYLYFEKPYYLVPGKNSEKGYVLLVEVLKKLNRVGIGKVVIHTRQYLVALFPHENALMLDLMRFDQEIRSITDFNIPQGKPKYYKITDKEFEMAQLLVESMTVAWDPKKYHDDYRQTLIKWIEKKAKHSKLSLKAIQAGEEGKETKVVDFMKLLKKSLQTRQLKTDKQVTSRKRTRAKLSPKRKKVVNRKSG